MEAFDLQLENVLISKSISHFLKCLDFVVCSLQGAGGEAIAASQQIFVNGNCPYSAVVRA